MKFLTHLRTALMPISFAEAIAGVRLIPLSRGLFTVVDAEDVDAVVEYKWCYSVRGYAVRNTSPPRRSILPLHRSLLNVSAGEVVDHKNGNRLDNRRSNLRVVSPLQNAWNSSAHRDSLTSVKGVYQMAGRFYARIMKNGVNRSLGGFPTAMEAGKAYAKAAKELHGEFHRSE